jgi:hypothetical protein
MDKFRCWFLIFTVSASPALAQDTDSLTIAEASNIFSSDDSLSIFMLIDSLLAIEAATGSQLAIRTSYNSNVLLAGRTLGIQNFGLAPGVSYYHKTGLYADVAAYWSQDFIPSYYLTIASLGYMHDFSKRFSLMAAFDKYFYRLDDGDNYIPYRHAASISPILNVSPLSLSMTYSYYFGDKHVHRVMPALSATFQTRKLWKLSRAAISPAVYVLWGTEIVYELLIPSSRLEALQFQRDYGTPYPVITKELSGIMNYAFTVPLNLTWRKWSLSFSYTYSIPRALKGEVDVYSNSTFLSGSLLYVINLKPQKSTL